ncbi:sensor histidine kinase [Chamaesiphon minutus]|uniref:histidine kinase n=1 Tax=Chamaesiphon minutus (strain ATCC 27169 / PCC 6605) TaxID=1173020 RepID=K9UKL2_CHAP6|nr:ATP-binding protein [Chamaesiphon minutus]AFY95345.1 PAS domain S-box [Chamaesiphon minutus PCC 6605]
MNLPTFTLLIVEDFPDNRELYAQCLMTDRSCDYKLLEAESVAQGLNLCRLQPIDAILLDYALPDGDGLEFLEALSLQGNGSIPPVVMMTGRGDENIAVRAMKSGVEDYLVKRDFTPQLLQLTMRNAIENARLRLQLRQSEERLQASEAQLRIGIEVAAVGLAKFDYVSNLVTLSPKAAALYGFGTEEAVVTRQQIHDTFHPDERAELEKIIDLVLDPQGQGWFALDHRVVWPNGEVRCLSVRKQVFFDYAGAVARPSHAILAAIDITDRNQTQAALEQRNQELDSFVYVVSHDLKAPLRAIANLSQWIAEDFQGTLSPHNQQQMTILRDRVYNMEATIDGLLEYARTGQTDAQSELVGIDLLLADVIARLAPAPTFTISIDSGLPTIATNRLLLFQVFDNTIRNAIDHHDRSDGSMHISCQERGDFYEFAIADDGPGIALEHQDRIFELFQTVNPQKQANSTGIGLAIVKKIVAAEGGTIRLESQLGRGTTFYFTWPKY